MELPERTVYRKIIQTGRLAEKLGAQILGLGAFTSVVGDAGVTIANALDVPVTTGDSYTVTVAVDAIREAAGVMDIPLRGRQRRWSVRPARSDRSVRNCWQRMWSGCT